MGTFSKAIGCLGGYITGIKDLIRFTTMATHTREQIDTLLNVCEEVGQQLKII